MKYSQKIGVVSALLVIASCFMPWAYYPDIQKVFTGFFSQNNHYGRPGVFLVPVATISIIFFLIPKVWAKRWNLLIAALLVAYAVKSYILFSSGYNVFEPTVLYGLVVMLASAVLVMIMALLPDLDV